MARSWGETRCQVFRGAETEVTAGPGGAAGALLPAPRMSPAATTWRQAPSPSCHRSHPPQRDLCRARGFAVPPRTPAPHTAPLLLCNVPIPAQTSCSVPVVHQCPGQPSYHPDPEHTAPLGTSVSSPQFHLHPPCPRHISFFPPAEPPARGAMGQARLCLPLRPARWMLKAGSGHREGNRRPRSGDGASRSSVRWKHHPWWGLAGLHPEEPLRGPFGEQRISTGSPMLP